MSQDEKPGALCDGSMPTAEPVPEITPEEREKLKHRWAHEWTWRDICQHVFVVIPVALLGILLVVPLSIGLGILGAVGMRVLEGAALLAFLLSGVRWLWQRFKRR
jgi:hypothetical protein